jgi:hypothetical protein
VPPSMCKQLFTIYLTYKWGKIKNKTNQALNFSEKIVQYSSDRGNEASGLSEECPHYYKKFSIKIKNKLKVLDYFL